MLYISCLCRFCSCNERRSSHGIAPAILSHVALAIDVQAQHVGFLTGTYLLAMFIAAPALGYLSDHIDRRAILVSAMGVYTLSLYALSATTSLVALYAIRILAGFGAGAILPMIQAHVADHSARAQRMHCFAWLVTATLSGNLAGPYLGGLATGLETWSRSAPVLPAHLIMAPVLAVALLSSAALVSIAFVLRNKGLAQAGVCVPLAPVGAFPPSALYVLFAFSVIVMFALGPST